MGHFDELLHESAARYNLTLSVPCPRCKAEVGALCTDARGAQAKTLHAVRAKAADKAKAAGGLRVWGESTSRFDAIAGLTEGAQAHDHAMAANTALRDLAHELQKGAIGGPPLAPYTKKLLAKAQKAVANVMRLTEDDESALAEDGQLEEGVIALLKAAKGHSIGGNIDIDTSLGGHKEFLRLKRIAQAAGLKADFGQTLSTLAVEFPPYQKIEDTGLDEIAGKRKAAWLAGRKHEDNSTPSGDYPTTEEGSMGRFDEIAGLLAESAGLGSYKNLPPSVQKIVTAISTGERHLHTGLAKLDKAYGTWRAKPTEANATALRKLLHKDHGYVLAEAITALQREMYGLNRGVTDPHWRNSEDKAIYPAVAEDSMGRFDELIEKAPGPGLARFKHNKALAKKHKGVAAAAGIYSFPSRGDADGFINDLRKNYPGLPTRAETKTIDGKMRFVVRFDEFREGEDDEPALTEGLVSNYNTTSQFHVDDLSIGFGPYARGTPDHFALQFKQGMSQSAFVVMPEQTKAVGAGLKKLADHISKAKLTEDADEGESALTESKVAKLLAKGKFDYDERENGIVVNDRPDAVERYLRRNGVKNAKVKSHAMGALVTEDELIADLCDLRDALASESADEPRDCMEEWQAALEG